MKKGLAWFALLFLGVMLIVAGFQGSGGRFLAVFLTPGRLQPTSSTAWQ